jgi:hypothetical protein
MRYRGSAPQIFTILFLLSFGAYFLRFLGGIGRDVPLRSVDPLRGATSAAELNDRINKELAVAKETGILAKDRQRLWIFPAGPPLAALISITACVAFFFEEAPGSRGCRGIFFAAIGSCDLRCLLAVSPHSVWR